MATSTITLKARANKALKFVCQGYHNDVPLVAILDTCRKYVGQPLQEDGTPWTGWLLGSNDSTNIAIQGFPRIALHISWYRMDSGRWEVAAYVS